MQIYRLMFSASVILSSVIFGAAKRPGVLRRRRVDREDYRECPRKGPNLWIMYSAERPHSTESLFFNPNFDILRDILSWDEEDIEMFWEDTIAHMLHTYGVDFTNVETDPATGTKTTPDGAFTLMVTQPPFPDFVITGTSMHGDLSDCPMEYRGEFITMLHWGGGTYHGTYGGEEGKTAQPGDANVYGIHAWDLDQDGVFDPVLYTNNVPIRGNAFGGLEKDLQLFSDEFGEGRQFGYCTDNGTPNADGTVDRAGRAQITFPATW